jgi:hypothetical protein
LVSSGDIHNGGKEKSSGQIQYVNNRSHMERTSDQPQVKLSLLHRNSLKIQVEEGQATAEEDGMQPQLLS